MHYIFSFSISGMVVFQRNQFRNTKQADHGIQKLKHACTCPNLSLRCIVNPSIPSKHGDYYDSPINFRVDTGQWVICRCIVTAYIMILFSAAPMTTLKYYTLQYYS